MKKLIVQHKVYAEVEEIWLYYENIISGLGDQFLDEWEKTLYHIEKYPEHFAREQERLPMCIY